MKAKIIILTAATLFVFATTTNAQVGSFNNKESFTTSPRHNININDNKGIYTIEHNRVLFNGAPVKFADVNSFRIIGHGYAKDRYNVYMNGTILPFVDPSSFKLKDQISNNDTQYGRVQDRTNNNDRLKDEIVFDEGEFEHGEYYKTTFDVFYNRKKIKDAMASSFVVLKGGYAKDAFNVYYRGEKVKDAMASSFVYDGRGYGHDAFNAYYKGKKLE
jgi:hypothetical protein